jgi:hypothetical protein
VTRMRETRNKYKILVGIFMARDKFEDRYTGSNVTNRLFCFVINLLKPSGNFTYDQV